MVIDPVRLSELDRRVRFEPTCCGRDALSGRHPYQFQIALPVTSRRFLCDDLIDFRAYAAACATLCGV